MNLDIVNDSKINNDQVGRPLIQSVTVGVALRGMTQNISSNRFARFRRGGVAMIVREAEAGERRGGCRGERRGE